MSTKTAQRRPHGRGHRLARAATAALGALALGLLAAPPAQADLSDPAGITGGTIHSGALVLGPDQTATFEVSFTARDDSGIDPGNAEANLLGPNGNVIPTVPATPGQPCTPTGSTTATCRFTATVDTGSAAVTSDYAGRWRLWGLAVPNDWNPATGEGLVTRANLDSFSVKRRAQLTADAFPEPVRAGRSMSVLGKLTFADWTAGGYTGTAGHPVRLVFYPSGGPYYDYVQDLETYSGGLVLTTTVPEEDGSWFLAYNGSDTTSWVYSASDWVDVQ